MMLIEDPPGAWRVEVVTLAPSAFPNVMEAELHVFSGEGGVAWLPLWDGTVMRVKRDKVEAICGSEES